MSFVLVLETGRLLNAADRASIRALGDAGAIVRDSARASIMKAPGSTPPGSIPRMNKSFFVRLISTGVDTASMTAVVGPTANSPSGVIRVMRALERGGDLGPTIYVNRQGRARGSSRRRKARRIVRVIAPRPYMAPALERSAAALAEFWRDRIR